MPQATATISPPHGKRKRVNCTARSAIHNIAAHIIEPDLQRSSASMVVRTVTRPRGDCTALLCPESPIFTQLA